MSEAPVGRFCRRLGYESSRDLKDHLRYYLSGTAWLLSDWLLEARKVSENEVLAKGLDLEIAELVIIHEQVRSQQWPCAIRRIASVMRIFVAGFQREWGVAQHFAQMGAEGFKSERELSSACVTWF